MTTADAAGTGAAASGARTPDALTPDEAKSRLHELTLVDVRTPAEYASGHLPGAHNLPLESLERAVPVLRRAAGRAGEGGLLVVCASGARSAQAAEALAGNGVAVATLTGGTAAWQAHGYELERPAGGRTPWAMERQVRLAAGSLVLAGLAAGRLRPAARALSAGVAGGLVFSALTDTCGMARLLAKLPHNRPRPDALDATLAALDA